MTCNTCGGSFTPLDYHRHDWRCSLDWLAQVHLRGQRSLHLNVRSPEECNTDYIFAALLVREVRRQPCPACGEEHLPGGAPGCPYGDLLFEWDAAVMALNSPRPAARRQHHQPRQKPAQAQLTLF